MNLNLLKKVPIALAAFAMVSANAADMDTRVTQLEHHMQQVRTETSNDTFGAKTAAANPMTTGSGYFITLGVVYAQAKVGGTEYCYTDSDTSPGTIPVKGTVEEAKFKWKFGVDVGLGVHIGHDDWDLYANYTNYSSSASRSKDPGSNSSVVALRGVPNLASTSNGATLFTQSTKATSAIKYDYNAVYLEMGRNYFVSSKLSFRPSMGVESVWAQVDNDIQYSGGDVLGNNTIHVHDNCDFWGVGPRGAINSKWHLGYGFSLFGNLAGKVYYGHFDVDHKEWNSANEAGIRFDLNADTHRFVPAVHYELGIAFDKYLVENRHHLMVRLGYDARYMCNAYQVMKLNMGTNNVWKFERSINDVAQQGVKLEVRWDF